MRICCFSQPKAGTHLLLSLAKELIGSGEWINDNDIKWTSQDESFFFEEVDARVKKYGDSFAVKGHIPFSESVERGLKKRNFNIMFIQRDPREIVCSTYRWLKDLRANWELSKYLMQFDEYSALLHIIEGLPSLHPIQSDIGVQWSNNIIDRHKDINKWLTSDALIFRYETLSGNQGRNLQNEALMSLRRITGCRHFEDSELCRIAEVITQPTSATFHTGKADTWRSILHPYHLHRIWEYSKASQCDYNLSLSQSEKNAAEQESLSFASINTFIEGFNGVSLSHSEYLHALSQTEIPKSRIELQIKLSKRSFIPRLIMGSLIKKEFKNIAKKVFHSRIFAQAVSSIGYIRIPGTNKLDIVQYTQSLLSYPLDNKWSYEQVNTLSVGGRLAYSILLGNESFGIELGVAEGYFSEIILQSSKVKRLISIDAWSDHHDSLEYIKACARLAPYGNRSIVMRSYFSDAINLIPDNTLDFIYFDAYAHTGQQDGKLFEQWYPKLKVGGLCSGHDYDSEYWPQTVKAVDRFAASIGKTINIIPGVDTKNPQDNHPSWYFYK